MPQIVMLTRDWDVENITTHYVAALGSYRALYILNWIYRAWTEPGYMGRYDVGYLWVLGIIQTALFTDFFYQYFCRRPGTRGAYLPVQQQQRRA